jgi:glycosyltransferase involved in cell wall biosynthesis
MLTWNRKKFVEELLHSFYQNISNAHEYEFIIVDNGSDDGTVELLKDAQKRNDKINVFYNNKNKGLSEYKRLFRNVKGEYIIIIDDDVIQFPKDFDDLLFKSLNCAKDFGFIALDVVQDEFTNGAKPEQSQYKDIKIGEYTISEGPTGGWCTILRKSDFDKIKFFFYIHRINMRYSEDGVIAKLMKQKLKLKEGLLKDIKCLHACGPYYSKQYGFLDRDIRKYRNSKLKNFVKVYESYIDKKS